MIGTIRLTMADLACDRTEKGSDVRPPSEMPSGVDWLIGRETRKNFAGRQQRALHAVYVSQQLLLHIVPLFELCLDVSHFITVADVR